MKDENLIIEYAYEHYNLEDYPQSLDDIPQDIIEEIIKIFNLGEKNAD